MMFWKESGMILATKKIFMAWKLTKVKVDCVHVSESKDSYGYVLETETDGKDWWSQGRQCWKRLLFDFVCLELFNSMVTQVRTKGKALRRKSNDEPSPEKGDSSKPRSLLIQRKKQYNSFCGKSGSNEKAFKRSSHFLDHETSEERQDKRSTRATKGKHRGLAIRKMPPVKVSGSE